METGTQSTDALDFAQRSQALAGFWTALNYVNAIDTTWGCLLSRPSSTRDDDRGAICSVISRIAIGTRRRFLEWDLAPRDDRRMARQLRIEQLLHLVWSRHNQCHLTLHSLARELDMSEPYLSRSLSHLSLHCFSRHVSGFRILDAVVLLERDDLLVKQVALEAGFSSTGELDRYSHFWLGMTPQEFRMSLRRTVALVRAAAQ